MTTGAERTKVTRKPYWSPSASVVTRHYRGFPEVNNQPRRQVRDCKARTAIFCSGARRAGHLNTTAVQEKQRHLVPLGPFFREARRTCTGEVHMIAVSLAQTAWVDLAHAASSYVHALLGAPLAAPEPKEIDTNGVLTFLATKIAPILLAVLGVIFISRAGKGEMSKVLTSSAIAIVGLAFIAGASALFFFGQGMIDLIFGD